MTILSLDSSLSTDLKNDKLFSKSQPISPLSCCQMSMLPRLNLRKRSYCRHDRSEVNLAAVNSAFLSGLFADVAAAQSYSSTRLNGESDVQDLKSDFHNPSSPRKKSRSGLTMLQTSVNCLKALHGSCSPNDANTSYLGVRDVDQAVPLNHIDSLHLQLSSVSNPSSTDVSAIEATPALLIFPHLPTMISDTSCSSSATRSVCDPSPPASEVSCDKEGAYGWFVEMDDYDGDNGGVPESHCKAPPSALAFSAPIAPKATNYEAELEWAKAADTVDDVLGDFF